MKIIFFIVITTLASAFSSCKSEGKRYTEAKSAYDAGNYNKAVELFSAIIQSDPSNGKLYFYRGTSYNNLGRYSLAESDLLKALEMGINTASTYANLGITYLNLKDFSNSIKYLKLGYLRDSSDSIISLDLGESFFGEKEYKSAIKYFTRVYTLTRTKTNDMYMLATSYYVGDEYEKALDCYNIAIDSLPKFSQDILVLSYLGRAGCNFQINRYPEAIDDCNFVIDRSPRIGNINSALYFRAISYKEIGKIDSSCEDLKRLNSNGYQNKELEQFLNCK